jgi:hypothetical protein
VKARHPLVYSSERSAPFRHGWHSRIIGNGHAGARWTVCALCYSLFVATGVVAGVARQRYFPLAATAAVVPLLASLSPAVLARFALVSWLSTLPMAESWRYAGFPGSLKWVGAVLVLVAGARLPSRTPGGRRERWLRDSAYLCSFAILAFIAAASTAVSFASLLAILSYAMPMALLPALRRVVTATGVRLLVRTFLVVVAVVGLVGTFQVVAGLHFARFDLNIHGQEVVSDVGLTTTVKAVAFSPYGTIYSNFLAIGLTVCAFVWRTYSRLGLRTRDRLLSLMAGISTLFGLILGYERLATIAGISGAVLIVLGGRQKVPARLRLAVLAVAAGWALVSSGIASPLIARLQAAGAVTTVTGQASTTQVRAAAMETGLAAVRANPLGLGAGSSQAKFTDYSVAGNIEGSPHDGALFLAVEVGFLAATVVTVWLVANLVAGGRGDWLVRVGLALPVLGAYASESLPAAPEVWWAVVVPIVLVWWLRCPFNA